MDDTDREFDYKANLLGIVLLSAAFAGATIAMAIVALTNDRTVILFRLIRLEPPGSTVLWWLVTVFFAGMCGLCLALLYQRLAVPQRITIGVSALTVPASR